MAWSWKIARIKGIDVSIHFTFPLLLLWIGLNYWKTTQNWTMVVQGLSLIILLFTCVVLHEFGHALTARRFGIKTRSITLLPIGGVAAMEAMPRDPRQEILVAAAGPAVNLVIAAVLWLWLALTGVGGGASNLLTGGSSMLYQLMVINLVLAVFNLLPAFPMDGGRVLRAALSLRMDREEATRKAVAVGQSLAAVMFAFGLLYNPFLMLIAVFVWFAAAAELSAEIMHSALFKATAGHSMITRFEALQGSDRLQHAVDLTLSGNQRHFPVHTQGRPLYLLTQTDMLKALRAQGEGVAIGELPLRELPCIEAGTTMETIFARLQDLEAPLLGVTEREQLVGIIDLENVIELINIEEAIKAHQLTHHSRPM
jgi:Zn-dependent protease